MSDKYGIDEKTRFLVLYLDAKVSLEEISRIINRSLKSLEHWVSCTKSGNDIRIEKKGRKKKFTEETEEKIIQMVRANPEGATLKKVGKLIYRTFFSDEMGIELNRAHKNRAWQLAKEKLRKRM